MKLGYQSRDRDQELMRIFLVQILGGVGDITLFVLEDTLDFVTHRMERGV